MNEQLREVVLGIASEQDRQAVNDWLNSHRLSHTPMKSGFLVHDAVTKLDKLFDSTLASTAFEQALPVPEEISKQVSFVTALPSAIPFKV